MALELKLSDADREKFGGPEWLSFDDEGFADLNYDKLTALERPMLNNDGISLAVLLGYEWPRKTMVGIRGMHWIARQLAGLTEPAWEDFKPVCLDTDYRQEAVDVRPPAEGSSEPRSEKTARSKKA